MSHRPIALVAGVSRTIGIGASIALTLAKSGWDAAIAFWSPYDVSMPWGSKPEEIETLQTKIKSIGARTTAIEADLSQPESAGQINGGIR